jgi:hypothetical protein
MFACQIDDHLSLRLPSRLDAEESAAVIGRDLDHLARWTPWATPETATVAGQRGFIERSLAR